MAEGKNDDVASGNGNPPLGNDGNTIDASSVSGGAGSGEIAGLPAITPGDTAGGSGGEPAKRGRGRPAGSGNKSKPASAGKPADAAGSKPAASKEKISASVKGIEKLLYSIHAGVAGFTKIEELAIDREESKQIAEALADVASHYNTVIDPKTMAWAGLLGAVATVYGPRIAAMKLGKKAKSAIANNGEIAPQPANTSVPSSAGANVVQMTSAGFPFGPLPAVNVGA